MKYLLTLLIRVIKCVIYNNCALIVQERGEVKVKISKSIEDDLENGNFNLKVYEESYNFRPEMFKTTAWLGLPWKIIKKFVLNPKELLISSNFYYFTVEFYPEYGKYYSIAVDYKNIEYFTTPLYYSELGFIRPIDLDSSSVGKLKISENLVRAYCANFDDFKFNDWARNWVLFLIGCSYLLLVLVCYYFFRVRALSTIQNIRNPENNRSAVVVPENVK